MNPTSICPSCDEYTFLRSQQRFAEQKLAQYEALIRARQDKECWIKILERLGVSRQEFERRREELSAQLDEPAGVYDTVWIILQERGVWERAVDS